MVVYEHEVNIVGQGQVVGLTVMVVYEHEVNLVGQ